MNPLHKRCSKWAEMAYLPQDRVYDMSRDLVEVKIELHKLAKLKKEARNEGWKEAYQKIVGQIKVYEGYEAYMKGLLLKFDDSLRQETMLRAQPIIKEMHEQGAHQMAEFMESIINTRPQLNINGIQLKLLNGKDGAKWSVAVTRNLDKLSLP